jgi:hypothetical protein
LAFLFTKGFVITAVVKVIVIAYTTFDMLKDSSLGVIIASFKDFFDREHTKFVIARVSS